MNEQNLTQGSVMRNLIRFSLPFLLSSFLQTFYGMVDLFVVGLYNAPSTPIFPIICKMTSFPDIHLFGLPAHGCDCRTGYGKYGYDWTGNRSTEIKRSRKIHWKYGASFCRIFGSAHDCSPAFYEWNSFYSGGSI